MTTVYLSASKISILTGNNRFESLRDFIQQLWIKYNYNDYINLVNELNKKREKGVNNVNVKETLEKKLVEKNIDLQIKNMSKEDISTEILNRTDLTQKDKIEIKKELDKLHNIDENKVEYKKEANKIIYDKEIVKNANLSSDVNKTLKSVHELETNKKKIMKKIDKMDISIKEKELIKKSVNSVSNKRYGTEREKSTVEYLYNKHNVNVIINKKYFKKSFYKTYNTTFKFVGEIDGMLEDGTIIEIKNRTKRLFKRVYNYEKDQLYVYMYLLQKDECILVEQYNNLINDILVKLDNKYMNNLLNKLKLFGNYYSELIHNIDMQKELLLCSDSDFKNIYLLRAKNDIV
tara:strand:- start:753 stop:1793 length:1041 start_codon:yes stop_codon:yes gene_type:complete